MTHYHRDPPRTLAAETQSRHAHLLVSGCSFTHNHANKHVVNWPYYLRDLAGFQRVLDVSLSGGGCQHIYNSIINECENNPLVSPHNTLVMVMWSGMTRTDVIAETALIEPWTRRAYLSIQNRDVTDGVYRFNDRFSTLKIENWRDVARDDKDPIVQMRNHYKRVIDADSQVLQSMINIVALAGYLESRGFEWMFMSWKDPTPDLAVIPGALSQRVGDLMRTVLPIGDYAMSMGQLDHTQHPTIEANLAWTRQHLLPALRARGLAQDPDPV